MPIRYETEGDIAVFTIENGAVNPMQPAMHKQLHAALTRFLRHHWRGNAEQWRELHREVQQTMT